MSKFGKGLFQLGDPLASFQSGFLTAEGLRKRGAGHQKKDSGSGAAAAGDAPPSAMAIPLMTNTMWRTGTLIVLS